MNGEAIKEVERLTKETMIHQIKGEAYSHHNLKKIIHDPQPVALQVESLTALAAYINLKVDSHDKANLFVTIEKHNKVVVYRHLNKETMSRHAYIVATPALIDEFQFGKFMDLEAFLISLRSRFKETPDQKRILEFLSRVVVGGTIQSEDDGISQSITVKRGMSGAVKEKETAPTLVVLTPYRTFIDVDQPQSEFILRMKQQGEVTTVGLFDADGGAWRLKASESVATFLKENIKDVTVIA